MFERAGRQKRRGRKKLPTYSIKGTNNVGWGGGAEREKGSGGMWFPYRFIIYLSHKSEL